MKVNGRMISIMEMVYYKGQMGIDMMGIGLMD